MKTGLVLFLLVAAAWSQTDLPPCWQMAADDFEAGNLDQWGKVPAETPAAQPQIASGSGHDGSNGLVVDVSGAASYIYQSGLYPGRQAFLEFRFHPNSVVIPDAGSWIPGKSIRIADIKGGTNWDTMVGVSIRQVDGHYRGYLFWYDAISGATVYDYAAGEFIFANAWHKMTIGFAHDESITVWLDDVLVRQLTGIAHGPDVGNIIEIGKCSNPSNSPTGTLLFDEVMLHVPRIADLYVNAATGSDSNDGKTPGAAFATIGQAASLAGPGTEVHIAQGVYPEKVRVRYSGTADEWVQFLGEPAAGDSVIIDGTGIPLTAWYGLFIIDKRSYVRVSGLHVKNSQWSGLFVYQAQNVALVNNSSRNTRSAGIYVGESDHVLVSNNVVRQAVNGGSGECLTLSNTHDFEACFNVVHDGVGLEIGGEGIAVGRNSYAGLVHHNHVYDLPGDVGIYIDAMAAARPDHLHDVEAFCNLVSTPIGIAIGAEIGGHVDSVRVYNNVLHDCYHYGMEITNWVLPNTGTKSNIYIYNNTVYQCGHDNSGSPAGGGIYIESKQSADENFVICNNLLSANPGYHMACNTEALDNSTFAYNLSGGLLGHDSRELLGDHPIIAEPGFVDAANLNFHLRPGSAAIDAGAAAPAPITDYDGRARPCDGDRDGISTVDVGAFEYYSALPMLAVRCLLQGFFNPDNHTLSTLYRQNDQLPLQSPYSENPRTAAGLSNQLADWVLLEIRNAEGTAVMADTSLFLDAAGRLVDEFDHCRVEVPNLADGVYRIAIRHRNHLAALSATPIPVTAGQISEYDFAASPSANQHQQGVVPLGGYWGMAGGDMNRDGQITTRDYIIWYNGHFAGLYGYQNADLSGDGVIDSADYEIWRLNALNDKSTRGN